MSRKTYASKERQMQIERYDLIRHLVNEFYPNNIQNFHFLKIGDFNRLSCTQRYQEITRVTVAFNSPW